MVANRCDWPEAALRTGRGKRPRCVCESPNGAAPVKNTGDRRVAFCTPARFGAGPAFFSIPVSDRGALRRLSRLRRVELPFALLNAASPLVPGEGGADMVWASAFASGGDLLLGLAGCQGKDLISPRPATGKILEQGLTLGSRPPPRVSTSGS
jgi:hypothetical protein